MHRLARARSWRQANTVYASADRMYITTNIWEPIVNEQTNEWLDENYQTAIHRFSIAGDGPASYEASGSVTATSSINSR